MRSGSMIGKGREREREKLFAPLFSLSFRDKGGDFYTYDGFVPSIFRIGKMKWNGDVETGVRRG